MKTNPFVSKFADSIVATLGCFDRVIFKGYLPFGGDQHLTRFVDHPPKMRRKDFIPWVEQASEALVAHGQRSAEQAGVPYQYLQGRHSKEEIVHDLLRDRRHGEGLVASCAARRPAAPSRSATARANPGPVSPTAPSACSTSSVPTSA